MFEYNFCGNNLSNIYITLFSLFYLNSTQIVTIRDMIIRKSKKTRYLVIPILSNPLNL